MRFASRYRRLILAVPVLCTLGCSPGEDGPAFGTGQSAAEPPGGAPGAAQVLVRQIDHVLIQSQDADALFALLSDTFELPVAWPMQGYGGFASGGVSVGNVNLEVIRTDEAGAGQPRSRFTGFALEPEPLAASLPALRARGVAHGRPAPYRARQSDGSLATLWTTVGLPTVSGDAASIFFCEYAHDVPETRRRLRETLESRGGGPLSAVAVTAVVYGAADAQAMRTRWQALLAPLEPSAPGLWRLGAGPAVRVEPAAQDGIVGIVIEVASLDRARAFLADRNLLGAERPGEIALAGAPLDGLGITLVGP